MRTVKSNDTLTNFTKLFRLATAASQNMTLSRSLKNVNTVASLALVLKGISLAASRSCNTQVRRD